MKFVYFWQLAIETYSARRRRPRLLVYLLTE